MLNLFELLNEMALESSAMVISMTTLPDRTKDRPAMFLFLPARFRIPSFCASRTPP
jgi:hypothetical protein